jgi:hypothetical protein
MMKSNVDPVQDDSAITLKRSSWRATALVANSLVSMTRIPENMFVSLINATMKQEIWKTEAL